MQKDASRTAHTQDAERVRETTEAARRSAEQARDAAMEAVRATSDTLAATLKQMKPVEEMRRSRDRQHLTTPS